MRISSRSLLESSLQFNQDFSCEARGMLEVARLAPSLLTLRGASRETNCPAEPKTYIQKASKETCTMSAP